ncbi:hypothetical protein [Psychromonas aquatilis]|uniref:Relaxase/mobilization nuclease-like protein n=1 Tax=Psychromonas aquatilis TaxID=2005072 RepID=A0ABU9GRV1_9GAMM
MIVKMAKSHYTFTDRESSIKKKGSGGLANHIYYLISDKKTGLYSKERCNLEVKLNPKMADLGLKLDLIGENLSKKELKNLCNEEAEKQKEFFNHYVANSRKKNELDLNGECFDKKKLFNYKCNFTFQKHEYNKILDHFKGNEEKTKEKMKEIQNEFFCVFYNDLKKAQGIKGRLTKRSDIEVLSNWHIDNEENPHIHSYLHPFDPVSKCFMNARDFGLAKQTAHTKLEKKYKQFLDQGISLGFDKINGVESRRTYLSELLPEHGLRGSLDKFKSLQNNIGKVVSNPKLSTDEMKKELEKLGINIEVKVSGEKKVSNVHIRLKNSSAILTKHSFMNKEVRSKLATFAERATQDRKLGANNKTNKMEEVIQEHYSAVMKSLKKQSINITAEQQAALKLKAFYTFAERCRRSGVYVDINKQGNCSYIKMAMNNFNSDKNISLTKYKSSLMINNELKGKNIVSAFDLDVEDIEAYRMDHLNHIPNSLNYGKSRAYIKGNLEDINLVEYDHFVLKISKGFLTKKNITVLEKDNCLFFTDSKNRTLMKIENLSDNKQSITTSNLWPNEAATLLNNILIEDVKNLKPNEIITLKPDENNTNTNYDDLRHLELKLLFSTDKNSKKIKVKFPGIENDETLREMIRVEFERKMADTDKQFNRNVKSIKKGVYNFTEKSGLLMLQNPKLKDYHSQIQSKINDQIIELIVKEDVKEIRFNQQSNNDYMISNKDEILNKSNDLTDIEKQKIIAYYEEIEKGDEETNNINNQELVKENKNKIKSKGLKL